MQREWLREARKSRNMTQDEVAGQLGMTTPLYCYVEQGKRKKHLPLNTVIAISKLFRIPVRKIIEFEEES